MRDLVAGLVALALALAALLVGATLHYHRQRRDRARQAARASGRAILAEVPSGTGLILFAEDADCFYYDDRPIEKASIEGVRLLVNESVLAEKGSGVFSGSIPAEKTPDPFIRDRWDVVIETTAGRVVVACGAIRERISQDLARRIYEAVASNLRP